MLSNIDMAGKELRKQKKQFKKKNPEVLKTQEKKLN